jgi:hypothetical protein
MVVKKGLIMILEWSLNHGVARKDAGNYFLQRRLLKAQGKLCLICQME